MAILAVLYVHIAPFSHQRPEFFRILFFIFAKKNGPHGNYVGGIAEGRRKGIDGSIAEDILTCKCWRIPERIYPISPIFAPGS